MYLNFADTSRDPASFWDPQAYSRLRPVKAAVDPEDRIHSNRPIPLATTHWPRPTPERTTMPSHTTTTGADYLPRRLSDAVGSARYSARGDGDTVLFHAITTSRTLQQVFDSASL